MCRDDGSAEEASSPRSHLAEGCGASDVGERALKGRGEPSPALTQGLGTAPDPSLRSRAGGADESGRCLCRMRRVRKPGILGRLVKPEVENRLVGEDGHLKELLLLKFAP